MTFASSPATGPERDAGGITSPVLEWPPITIADVHAEAEAEPQI